MIDTDEWERRARAGDGQFAIACALMEVVAAVHRHTNFAPTSKDMKRLVEAVEQILLPDNLTVTLHQGDDD